MPPPPPPCSHSRVVAAVLEIDGVTELRCFLRKVLSVDGTILDFGVDDEARSMERVCCYLNGVRSQLWGFRGDSYVKVHMPCRLDTTRH